MAIVSIKVPKCDKCGSITLPQERLRDGSPNPARENPEEHPRCGNCKSPNWNYKAVGIKAEPEPKASKRTLRKRAH